MGVQVELSRIFIREMTEMQIIELAELRGLVGVNFGRPFEWHEDHWIGTHVLEH